MSNPYLYEEGPEALHTGSPRRRKALVATIFGGTALFAVGMVGALLLVRGSPEEQAVEAAGVFVAALGQGDTETAHGLLCEDERTRVAPAEVAAEYGGEAPGRVLDAVEGDGGPAREVRVQWADGAQHTLLVVNERGPRICGLS